jgi:hypothetical protein
LAAAVVATAATSSSSSASTSDSTAAAAAAAAAASAAATSKADALRSSPGSLEWMVATSFVSLCHVCIIFVYVRVFYLCSFCFLRVFFVCCRYVTFITWQS